MADELGWLGAWDGTPHSAGVPGLYDVFGPAGPVQQPIYPLQVSKLAAYALLKPEQTAVSKLSGYAVMWPDKAAVSKANAYAIIFEGVRVSKLTGYSLLWVPAAVNPFDGARLEAALDKQRSITQQMDAVLERAITASAFDDLDISLPADRAATVPYAGSDDALHPIPQAAFRGGVSRTDSGIGFVIENNAPLPITPGLAGFIVASDYLAITGWTLTADVAGSIEIDVWKDSGGIPSISGSITGSALPALVGARSGSSTTLTGWQTAIEPGDVLAFNVNSIASCSRVTLTLQGNRT